MRFIKKKNLGEGEDLLYVPHLHWLYAVKHLVLSLPFFIVLLILWFADNSLTAASDQMGYEMWLPVKFLVRQVFLAGILVLLVIFICRILLYLSTEYGVTNKRLIIKKGIIRVTVAEIPTDRIESIYCIQGIFGRIFHYGTVYISGIGGRIPSFYMVARPYALRRKIVNIIEKNKTITVIHGDPSRVNVPPKPEPVMEPEPLYRYGTFVRVLPKSDR
jgi:membrane protein YdbS with pleckstrin-like domain